MKKILTVSLLIFSVFFLCFAAYEYMQQKELDDLEKAFINAQPYDDVLKNEIIPRLNKAIDKYPDDTWLIENRMNTLSRLGLFRNAKKDAEKFRSYAVVFFYNRNRLENV